jgi:hypothetical protein
VLDPWLGSHDHVIHRAWMKASAYACFSVNPIMFPSPMRVHAQPSISTIC